MFGKVHTFCCVLKNRVELLGHSLERNILVQQVRYKFADWRMLKDYKKRSVVKEYGQERLRINAIRKNKILPRELKAIADNEIAALPVNSSIVKLVPRCVLTSRPRGVVKDYRISRICFRHLADYNKLSGVQRAMW